MAPNNCPSPWPQRDRNATAAAALPHLTTVDGGSDTDPRSPSTRPTSRSRSNSCRRARPPSSSGPRNGSAKRSLLRHADRCRRSGPRSHRPTHTTSPKRRTHPRATGHVASIPHPTPEAVCPVSPTQEAQPAPTTHSRPPPPAPQSRQPCSTQAARSGPENHMPSEPRRRPQPHSPHYRRLPMEHPRSCSGTACARSRHSRPHDARRPRDEHRPPRSSPATAARKEEARQRDARRRTHRGPADHLAPRRLPASEACAMTSLSPPLRRHRRAPPGRPRPYQRRLPGRYRPALRTREFHGLLQAAPAAPSPTSAPRTSVPSRGNYY